MKPAAQRFFAFGRLQQPPPCRQRSKWLIYKEKAINPVGPRYLRTRSNLRQHSTGGSKDGQETDQQEQHPSAFAGAEHTQTASAEASESYVALGFPNASSSLVISAIRVAIGTPGLLT